MAELWKFLQKAQVGLVALLIASLLLVLSRFEVGFDPYVLQRAVATDPTLALGAGGFFLLGTAALVAPHVETLLPWQFPRANVRVEGDDLVADAGDGEIRVRYGKLDALVTPITDALVVLPANEYFDDECVQDPHSVLGAFVHQHFQGKEREFLAAARAALPAPRATYEKVEGVMAESYGVGTTVYLHGPLGTTWRLLVVAVTTQRAGVGLKADVATLFRIVRDVQRTMADRRLREVYVPLLGAGHGGLPRRASLFCLVLGFADLMCHRRAHDIRKVHLVVYRADARSAPAVAGRTAKRILSAAVGMYADA